VCLILYILSARRVWWILEQPVSSVLQYHDRFQEFLKTHRVYRTYMCMGPYGAATLKPSYLYSQHELTEQSEQDCAGFTPRKQLVSRSVAGSVTGNANLKGSQAYPSRFGSAIEKLYTKHYTTLATNAAIMAASDHNTVTIADILDAVIVNKDCLHCMHMCTCKHACKHACTHSCSYACTCLAVPWCGTAHGVFTYVQTHVHAHSSSIAHSCSLNLNRFCHSLSYSLASIGHALVVSGPLAGR
jgi:hypothetical protein